MVRLYLTDPTYVLARTGTSYSDLDDTTINLLSYDAETEVYGHTGIYPTITEIGENAFSIQYTGASTPATITIDDGDMTVIIGATTNTYDLTDTDKDTMTKIVAILDALADVTCTIDTEVDGDEPSVYLSNVTSLDISSSQTLEYFDEVEGEIETEWSCDVITYRLMVASATAFAVSYALAKVLGIDVTGMNYEVALLSIQKDASARNMLKLVFFYRNIAKENLDRISDTPRRVRHAYLVSPTTTSSSSDTWPYTEGIY